MASRCHLHYTVYPHHPPSALIRRSPLQAVAQFGCSLFSSPLFTLSDSTFEAVLLVTRRWVGVGSSPNLRAHSHDCVAKTRFWLAERKRRMLFFSSFDFHHTQTLTNTSKMIYYLCIFPNQILIPSFIIKLSKHTILFLLFYCVF